MRGGDINHLKIMSVAHNKIFFTFSLKQVRLCRAEVEGRDCRLSLLQV